MTRHRTAVSMLRGLCAGSFIALLCACAATGSATTQACPSPTHDRFVLDRLYFGRAQPDGAEVPEADFERFLREEVSSRFPSGLTLIRADGQWLGASGHVVAEKTVILEVVHRSSPQDRRRVAEVAAAYKQQFRQESVLWTTQSSVCAAF